MIQLFTLLSVANDQSVTSQITQQTVSVGSQNVGASLDVFSIITSLFIVLFVIAAFAWLAKRLNLVQPQSQQIKVIASHNLGSKEKLVVVELNGEQLLLGVTAGQISLLQQLDKPLSQATPAATVPPLLEKLIRGAR